MVIEVTSKFRGGAFTQEISATNPPFGGTRSNPATNDAGRPPENATPNAAGSGPTPGNTGQTSGNTGTRVDTPYDTRTPTPTDTNNRTPATPVTPNGVANGDGSRRG